MHFCHKISVRFRDCDAMGHVNNAVYLTYLEEARFAHWRFVIGQTDPPDVILARAEIDYRKAARYGDTLEIRIDVERIGTTSLSHTYVIDDQNGARIAEGRSVLVWYDYRAGTPVPIPDVVRSKISEST